MWSRVVRARLSSRARHPPPRGTPSHERHFKPNAPKNQRKAQQHTTEKRNHHNTPTPNPPHTSSANNKKIVFYPYFVEIATETMEKDTVIGGKQSPLELLQKMMTAVRSRDLRALKQMKAEFLSIKSNREKCVDGSRNTLAHMSVGKTDEILKFVIDELACDVNAVNIYGQTPLHEAARQNAVQCCQTLLKLGATESVQTVYHSTPFHTAATCGNVDCLELFLRSGSDPTAKVNEVDRHRATALHKCAAAGMGDICAWLLEKGAQVDAVAEAGCTALLAAAKSGHYDVVELLVDRGADCNHADDGGNTCVHFCASRCEPRTLALLLKHGAIVNVSNRELNNPLHVAAINYRPDNADWETIMLDLVEAGCDTEHVNAAHKRPIDYVKRPHKKLFTTAKVKERQVALVQKKQALLTNIAENKAAENAALHNGVSDAFSKYNELLVEENRILTETEERNRGLREANNQEEERVQKEYLTLESSRQQK